MSSEKTVHLAVKKSGNPKLFIINNNSVTECRLSGRLALGRPSSGFSPDIQIPASIVSRHHGELMATDSACTYQDLGSSNGTILNGEMLMPNTPVLLNDGDVLRIHARGADDCSLDVILIYTLDEGNEYVWDTISLNDSISEIAIGREQSLSLSDQTVSRNHASFFRAMSGWAIIDHGSLNGVYINNSRIHEPALLSRMDVIQIGEYHFLFTGSKLLYQKDSDSVRNLPSAKSDGFLSIRIQERNVWRRMFKKTLLKDINLDIPAGSMVLILGGSGAGKTTFLNAVMGYEQAEGSISYKGIDIYDEYEKMKYEIGYVPQQDLLRGFDTVYDTLRNAAEMRLPSSLTEEERSKHVRETMHLLGLERESLTQVSKLSGGQRKRLSIAVEYIGNPSLFFLDEPDSGLDGTMARSLMEQLRKIADQGKIVLVISHSPDRAFELFDRIIVLAKGSDDCGHLTFYGSPREGCAFFGVEHLEQIVKKINRPDEGGEGRADEFIKRFGGKIK